MMTIDFSGWFQCRLATDPDPADEPRGISGMMKVYPGEPDLDRIIRFQPPVLQRSYCPEVGVVVHNIMLDGEVAKDHFLRSAQIQLAGNPIFKGDNGIVAEDGEEPIVPFIFEIKRKDVLIRRSCPEEPSYTTFPFKALQAKEINGDPDGIRKATGILDPAKHFASRASSLAKDLAASNALDAEIIKRRIGFLKSKSATHFFDYFMRYEVELDGPVYIVDPAGSLEGSLHDKSKWNVSLKFCGWDPDALSGYVIGKLEVP